MTSLGQTLVKASGHGSDKLLKFKCIAVNPSALKIWVEYTENKF